jgi:hypothetical protein
MGALLALELISQRVDWKDLPEYVDAAKGQLPLLRSQTGIRDRVARVREIFKDI